MTRQQHIQRNYARIATDYARFATIQQHVGNRLFERLSYLKLIPRTILDLGCGTGTFLTQLKQKYPQAQVLGLDLSATMLTCYKAPWLMRHKPQLIVGDMAHLPLGDHTIDMIFANQSLHWANDTLTLFQELNRVLAPEGVLMFSTLGPDTNRELSQAWAQIDSHQHVNVFKDMHDLGDEMLTSHFAEPVVDMEYFKVRYATPEQLIKDIRQQGVRNLHNNRFKGLTGKNTFQRFMDALSRATPQLTYEVIYGQAWQSTLVAKDGMMNGNEVSIPVHKIGKRPKDAD